ncbi:hypothetical protein [Amycolatopsis sp.]|uniref:hypothetical protein n=1 Tax=Amycolatopsis sp. TaxID=37632 RepID=UPI002E06F50A|nr:hypothetical protein [Amycolatopsis sp.]
MYLPKKDAPPAFQVFWPHREPAALLESAEPRLAERLTVSSLIGSADFDARVAPYAKWVTEIGLRPSREVQQAVNALLGRTSVEQRWEAVAPLETFDHFSRGLAERAGVTGRPAFDHRRWARRWLETGEHQVVTHTIAQYVDGVGSQADAVEVSAAVAESEPGLARTGTAAFLVLHAACAFAVVGDERCRGLFDAAADRMTGAWDRYFVLLRALTAEVKRLDGARLDEVRERAWDSVRTLSASYGDAAGALGEALLTNLDAYRAMKAGDRGFAGERIDRARELVLRSAQGETGYPWQIGSRYYVQVCQNWARTRLADPATSAAAVREMVRLVGFCRTDERDSLPEALSLLGLGLFRLGRYEEAIAPLQEAARELTGGISLIRRNTVVGTLIAAFDALGRIEEVERWAGELEPGDELLDRLLAERS